MRKLSLCVMAGCLLVLSQFALAEEARDLREGLTGELSTETKWGVLPRFKSNPDTGVGTGVKIKAQNVFGTELLLDMANIITANRFQTYEFLAVLPRMGGGETSWFYFMAYAQYDLIPDYRFFGVGNDTENEMFEMDDLKVGDESSFEYQNAQGWLVLGWHPLGNLYVSLEPSYRIVWLDDGAEDKLPNGLVKYADLPGTEGGVASGLGFNVVQATRNDQWRPTEGYRAELRVQDVADYFGADFNFTRYLFDLRYYYLLFGKYNVLALHGRVEALEGHNSEIPWWELVQLGGKDTARGYWEGRFRGKIGFQANIEYRYYIYHFHPQWRRFKPDFLFDGLFFYDAGQVFTSERELNKKTALDLHNSYGLGFRMTTPPNLMGRLDIGFSPEQTFAMYFNFGTVF